MTTTSPDLDALRHALPQDTQRSTAHYTTEGIEPRIAFQPNDRAEAALLLKTAAAAGLTVVPHGSRTALALGHPLAAHDVALDLRGLHRVVSYTPDDLTITVEAGMTLGALQSALAEHGQYLPVDAPPDDHVTIGGLLATARAGAWRGLLPGARDLILSIEAAMPSGALVKSGGRVVKNVTGYDLHRLHTGALGAFGVIVEATFKIAPAPAVTRTVAASASSVAEAALLARKVWDASLAVRAITVLPAATAAHLGLPSSAAVLVELAGSAASVDRSLQDLARLGPFGDGPSEGWAYLRRLHGDQGSTVFRLAAPPTSLAELIEAARSAGALAWGHVASGAVLAHWGEGAAVDGGTLARLRSIAQARGGYLQVEAAARDFRAANDPGDAGDAILVAALRDRFDPARTINRGRWGAGL